MDDISRKKLLEDYAKTRTPELREKIILEYAPLVKVVAGRLSMYLGYNVEYDICEPAHPGVDTGSDPENGLDPENDPAETEEDRDLYPGD